MTTIWDVIFKGGPGSGRKPTGRQTDISTLKKFDRKKYRTLDAKARVNMSAKYLNKYKSNYTVVSDQGKATAKMSPKSKKDWMLFNKNIGALEGQRKASINKGNKAQGKERRKHYGIAVSLQDSASFMAKERSNVR